MMIANGVNWETIRKSNQKAESILVHLKNSHLFCFSWIMDFAIDLQMASFRYLDNLFKMIYWIYLISNVIYFYQKVNYLAVLFINEL